MQQLTNVVLQHWHTGIALVRINLMIVSAVTPLAARILEKRWYSDDTC